MDIQDSLSILIITYVYLISIFIGGISKIIASTITYPYQLIKSKLQQREVIDILTKERVLRYTSTYDCMIKVWRLLLYHMIIILPYRSIVSLK